MTTVAVSKKAVLCLLMAAGSLPGQVALNLSPSRVVGHTQVRITTTSPNLPEARDLNNPSSVAVDASGGTPILYVADSGNNRVLAWRDARQFSNGAPADLVLGQRDFISTLSGGPGTELSTGLSSPTSVAVDSQGRVYVADAGNNRILRYTRPFDQTESYKLPDLVLGQPNFTQSRVNNTGNDTSATNARGLAVNVSGSVFRTGMVFDANGNLWFSDSGNNRLLRFPAAALDRNENFAAADQVLGQLTFTTSALPPNPAADGKNFLAAPSGMAIDASGRLYVADSGGRIVVFTRPLTGALADRIMGLVRVQPGQPPPPQVNETSLGRVVNQRLVSPEGLFLLNGRPFVLDTASNRILQFDPFPNWAAETTAFSPPGRAVIGQADFNSFRANRGSPDATNASFNSPVAATVANNEVFIADAGNHRVLVFPVQNDTIGTASRVLGQVDFAPTAPNSIDGREMFTFLGFRGVGNGQANDGAAIAIDNRSTPPRLYLADTFNHRILAFRDARAVRPGDRADLVIGQRDMLRSQVNNPANDSNQLTDQGLFGPAGVAVDADGALWVADSQNGRVLRFPSPFDQEGAVRPNLVIGQASFFQKVTDATSRTMGQPHGLAFTVDGHLLVSDAALNRVLFFRKPAGADFTTGQAAEKVFGQPDFSSRIGTNAENRMISPRGIATDTDDRLYVCDVGNNRVLIYDRVTTADTDAFPALTLPALSSPHSVFVSPRTGEIWVADTLQNRAIRLPRFIELLITGDIRSNYVISSFRPLALTQDSSGALFIADGTNRIAIHFPGLQVLSGGHLLPRVAPGGIGVLRPVEGASFGEASVKYEDQGTTAPPALGDIEVQVNGVRAPILSVAPGEVRFVLPKDTPEQTTEFLVARASNGQVMGATEFTVSRVAPALLTVNPDGNGQIVARNADGKDNNAIDRAGRSEVISLFATGFGSIGGAPEDGTPPADKVPFVGELNVVMGTRFVPADNIVYVGLAPGRIGVVQIDVRIPDFVPPDPNVPVVIQVASAPSNLVSGIRRLTTIAVKP